jgi:hypothetical protein
MKHPGQRIKESVMMEIANDYEEFEWLLNCVNRWGAEHGIAVDRRTVLEKLGELISEGYATAYVYCERGQEFRPAEYSPERVDELWFYLTPKGRQLVKQVEDT